jgi:hypothetical protein
VVPALARREHIETRVEAALAIFAVEIGHMPLLASNRSERQPAAGDAAGLAGTAEAAAADGLGSTSSASSVEKGFVASMLHASLGRRPAEPRFRSMQSIAWKRGIRAMFTEV